MIFLVFSLLVALTIFLAYVFFRLDASPLLAFYDRFYPNKKRLSGSTVWVVGSSTGIGEEISYQLAELGCRLILTSTTESKLNEVARECIKRSKNNLKPEDILVLPYDISDFKKNDEAFKTIIDKFGDIDLLINNAARVYVGKIEDEDFEHHRKVFDINYFANVYIAELVTRHWLKNKSKDKIIMPTSAIASKWDFPHFSTYISTKKAMNTFYTDLAIQVYDHNISVCLAMPGPTVSSFANKRLKAAETDVSHLKISRMTTERCAELMIIGAANRIGEFYATQQPFLIATYAIPVIQPLINYLFRVSRLKIYFKRLFCPEV